MMFFCYRDSVRSMQETLLNATYVARNGRPDPQTMTDWVDVRGEYSLFFGGFFNKETMCAFSPLCLLQSLHSNSSYSIRLKYGNRKYDKLMLWDSIPSAYPDLESYCWHDKWCSSKRHCCIARQVCIILSSFYAQYRHTDSGHAHRSESRILCYYF